MKETGQEEYAKYEESKRQEDQAAEKKEAASGVPEGGASREDENGGLKKSRRTIQTPVLISCVLLVVLVLAAVGTVSYIAYQAVNEMQALGEQVSASARAVLQSLEENRKQRETAPQPYDGQEEENVGEEESTAEETEPAEGENGYHPTPEDAYYLELADAVREDLSYRIEWKEYNVSNEDGTVTAAGRYPQISGEVTNKAALNVFLEEQAIFYRDSYAQLAEDNAGMGTCQISSYGYVTYMDEDTLSVVMDESVRIGDTGFIDLYAVNLDLNTGSIMENSQLVEYSNAVADAFRKQNQRQNGRVEAVDDMSDEVLLEHLSDPDNGIVYRTPVGLEIGFNYFTADDFGWVTVTLKEYARFVPKY